MATLTYDPTPADQPEFNEEEREALAIGEQAEAEQQQMLAGKFKDPEALEQAYLELQKKLGENNEPQTDEVRREETPTETEEVNPVDKALLSASDEWRETGTLSQETFDKLSELKSEDLLTAYLQAQANQPVVNDFSEADVQSIHQAVGGAEQYSKIIDWATNALPQETIQSYNNLVDTGDPMSIRLALAGIQAAYEDSNGFEGQMYSGKGGNTAQDVFRSQAEVVAAMQDPRYDRDPAYRSDVFEKLSRSNVNY